MAKNKITGMFFVFIFVSVFVLSVGVGIYLWQGSSSQEPSLQPNEFNEASGYIKNVYESGEKRYLNIDYVQWLSGEEAIQAMREDGECPIDVYPDPSYCIPNGYYIRNQDPEIETIEISKNVEIAVHTYASGECHVEWEEKINYETFKSFWESTPLCSHMKDLPYSIESQNGVVTKITEQFIP